METMGYKPVSPTLGGPLSGPEIVSTTHVYPNDLNVNDMIVAGIEVEAIELSSSVPGRVSTRISVIAGKNADSFDSAVRSTASFSRKSSRKDSLLSSSDSFDEIAEGSNEAKMIKRIARASSFLSFHPVNGIQELSSGGEPVGSFDDIEKKYTSVFDGTASSSASYPTHSLQRRDEEGVDSERSSGAGLRQGYFDEVLEHLITFPCCECTIEPEPKQATPILRPPKRGIGISPEISGEASGDGDFALGHHVEFRDIEVCEFDMTLGHHPSASSGPPIALDWDSPRSQQVFSLEEFEKARQPRRGRRHLRLTLQERHMLLVKQKGFTFAEIKQAWQDALEIRKQRRETLERGLAMMKWDEVWESVCRKFNRVVDGAI